MSVFECGRGGRRGRIDTSLIVSQHPYKRTKSTSHWSSCRSVETTPRRAGARKSPSIHNQSRRCTCIGATRPAVGQDRTRRIRSAKALVSSSVSGLSVYARRPQRGSATGGCPQCRIFSRLTGRRIEESARGQATGDGQNGQATDSEGGEEAAAATSPPSLSPTPLPIIDDSPPTQHRSTAASPRSLRSSTTPT